MEREDPWDENDGEELEAEIMRADHAFGVDLRGTTENEALAGQSLDQALARERPEARTNDEAIEIVDDGDPDVEGELVGEGFVVSDDFAAPEESALSVREGAPGATDHDDPHTPDAEVERNRLIAEEERLWTQVHELVDSLAAGGAVGKPGYFAEGWSAKDLVAHIGSWLAEAGVVLERIRFGTYRPEEIDIDATNAAFYEANRDVAFADVRAQAFAARSQMLRAWRSLPSGSPEADRWIRKAGPEHYAEHLPRLREWVEELSAST
jgi:hypothetical protein